ncbi:hypothetical protein [Subtercola sp. RTI3]|uniref:hypothetical protein n=1 Tax=Subtercola sp. RTI3 TaxID=3048639 RepID=UPI002B234177|nr:hypothetical protein [Subtercola sp. RTI3]MEA9986296.1 hypothetical protein [Subtercola sp. RTI3]
MSRVVAFDTRSGDFGEDIPFSTFKWEVGINTADVLSCAVNLSNPEAAALDLRSSAAPLKNGLAIIEGRTVPSAGVIWPHDYSKNTAGLTISAKGIWSLFDRRLLMPVSALTTPLLILEGDDAGKPNPAVATTFTGRSWGYIVRTVLQQSMAFPGGELPLVFEDDGTGSHDKTVEASSFKSVGSFLSDLTKLENGPEIAFVPRLRADRQGIEWVVRVGNDEQPRIGSDTGAKWDYSVPDRGVKDLDVSVDASDMISGSWASGGRPSSIALYSFTSTSELTDDGYPWTDSNDSTHTDVVVQETLDSYAAENLRIGARPVQFWPFSVRNDLDPKLNSFSNGDTCRLKLVGDPYEPDQSVSRRIVKLSGDEGLWMKVTTGAIYG